MHKVTDQKWFCKLKNHYSNEQNKKRAEEIYEIMSKNYEDMREKSGVTFYRRDDDFCKLDGIFKKLKPESPYKLSEMLNLKFNPMKLKELNSDYGIYSTERIKEYYMYNIAHKRPLSIFGIKRGSSNSISEKQKMNQPESYHRSLIRHDDDSIKISLKQISLYL